MQHRYFDYGDAATASLYKEMLTGISDKTVLRGGELGVVTAVAPDQPDRILIQPVWVMLSSPRSTEQGTARANVLLYEDEPQQLRVPTSSASAKYTIVYRHTDQDTKGGSAAVLTLDYGLLQNQNIDNGIVLGYVLYPGGGVGLDESMLVQAPQARIQAVSSVGDGVLMCPPFSQMVQTHLGGQRPIITTVDDESFGHAYEIDNRANSTQSTDRLRWSFFVGRDPPRGITFDYVQETGQTITIDVEDSEGKISSLHWGAGSVLRGMITNDFSTDFVLATYNNQSLRRRRLRITGGSFIPGKRFRVQATVQTASGKRTLVCGVGHTTYCQPFAG